MNKPVLSLLVIAVLLFAGCASLGIGSQEIGARSANGIAMPSPALDSGSQSYASGSGGTYSDSSKVIKTASASIEVPSGTLDSKYASLKEKITGKGGQIVSADYYETDSTKTYNVVLKVKPADFESLADTFKSIGTVKSMNSNVQDVGQQYTDIEIRIKNLEKQRDSITALLDRNGTLSDILAVETELNRVQTDIEMYQSQKLNMDRQIDMSTVNVRIYEEAPAVDKDVLLPLKDVGNIFLGALGFAILAISAIAGFGIPMLIVIGLVYMAYLKFFKKKEPKQQEKKK